MDVSNSSGRGDPEMAGDEKGRCVKCREWQEHYFWEHMDLSNIRFFKHMIGDFQHRVVSISLDSSSSICFPASRHVQGSSSSVCRSDYHLKLVAAAPKYLWS
jgi:hypothetical protein